MSAKEVWSKYRLALPVFLCLAVAGFIIAMLLRAGRSAEPPMYAVDSSDSRSRPSSQTATRSSTGSRPPTVASETTGEKPKDETAKPVTRSSRTAKTTTLRTSRTTTAKSTKSTSAKTTRSTADRSELYQKKLEELQKEYEKKQERVQDKLIDLEIQKEIDLAALDLYYASAGLAHGGAYEAEKNRILSQYEQEAAACRQQGEDWQREYADKVTDRKEHYGQE